jgi:hypothetical protein
VRFPLDHAEQHRPDEALAIVIYWKARKPPEQLIRLDEPALNGRASVVPVSSAA